MIDIHWHRRFIEMAGLVSTWSKDPSTKVGCVIVDPKSMIVVSMGFNGMARGVQERETGPVESFHNHTVEVTFNTLHPERWKRPQKYQWIVHAELNAILNAARYGTKLEGCWAYMNYEPKPCQGCANALVQAGITTLLGPNRSWDGKGTGAPYEVGDISQAILDEGGIRTEVVQL